MTLAQKMHKPVTYNIGKTKTVLFSKVRNQKLHKQLIVT